MHLAIIINSIVCVIGAILGVLVAAWSISRVADEKVPWVGRLVAGALLIPITFLLSGLGAWLANEYGESDLAVGLIALPWVYSLGFVIFMLVFLRISSRRRG